MPSPCPKLQKLMTTQWQQQQLVQTDVEIGKFLSVFCQSKRGHHGRPHIQQDPGGRRKIAKHGNNATVMIPLQRWLFMVDSHQ